MTSSNTKVYLEIVKKIRSIMEEDGLVAGDRLPSERELSSRLNVGRSSVREALRALELVGLIETRRGEGTFIRNFYDNGLVQLIAPFLLQDEKTIRDLLQTKRLLEKDMIRIVCNLPKETFSKVLSKLHQVLEGNENSISMLHQTFFKTLIEQVDNYLLYRIWMIVNDYVSTLSCKVSGDSIDMYRKLYATLEEKQENDALKIYDELVENIQFHS
ncbi:MULTISPECIES: FadR/GntR family transcriptional regulator [Bacillus]|uniref:Transcriptional regulator, GntR family n=1 Tax=Bacillus thuringiensis subsp. konkukian (strain 97-27) TaxID=281309 RepID=Q6HCT0_BACHK|nr:MULTISPECIES: GntR family transcriptional regulator [Bacillus]COE64836.1 GntR family transcriptional regulator [Streptococcus pneumoniae]AAT60900.1 transcriptional regulator, GntR family [[Bacillus thuringiensis] serovar konkukian str. 97-27]AJI33291.1 bacterial regulatory s, gntR family protein [Bacillus thuringiensis]KAB7640859.1 FadR family transcriptional regulator [Bacillus sp. B3-WWTP-C-10-D-3]MBL3849641.1 FadR family transcriptional regulator [Bacillus cereus]